MHKPANTCRIALVGSSIVMGYGVEDGEVFKVLLEEKLNSQLAPGRPRVELLNFGLGLSTSINRLRLIERKVFDFEPDALFYFAHQDELYSAAQFMPLVVQNKMPMPYPILGEVVRKSGVNAQTRPDLMERMFMPFSRELTLGLYRILAEECRKRGIPLVWIYLPMPGISRTPAEASAVIDVAREAGFQVLDLSGWSAGFAPAEVKLGREDQHPNPQGHRIIAERLFAELKKRPELLPKSVQLAP